MHDWNEFRLVIRRVFGGFFGRSTGRRRLAGFAVGAGMNG
jgi:hypothetical protein